MKITFANMVSALCERIPGGDVDVVTDALGLDRRIGRRYLTGGLGFGGPCFPRDNVALAFLAKSLGVSHELVLATDHFNRNIPGEALKRLERFHQARDDRGYPRALLQALLLCCRRIPRDPPCGGPRRIMV